MAFEQYAIVKLSTHTNQNVYVAIMKQLDDKQYRVKILQQPLYEMATVKHSTSLFQQFCHEDDVVDAISMQYDSESMTIVVGDTMLLHVTHNEIVDLLKYFNHTAFGENGQPNKSARQIRREKMIISNALNRLYSPNSVDE